MNKSLAEQLRDKAEVISKDNLKNKVNQLYNYLIDKCKKSSDRGHFEYVCNASSLHYSISEIEETIKALEKDGFTCIKRSEITNQYSVCDFDTDLFVTISWK